MSLSFGSLKKKITDVIGGAADYTGISDGQFGIQGHQQQQAPYHNPLQNFSSAVGRAASGVIQGPQRQAPVIRNAPAIQAPTSLPQVQRTLIHPPEANASSDLRTSAIINSQTGFNKPVAPVPVAPVNTDKIANTINSLAKPVGQALNEAGRSVLRSVPVIGPAADVAIGKFAPELRNLPSESAKAIVRAPFQGTARIANEISGQRYTPNSKLEKTVLGDNSIGRLGDYLKENVGVQTGIKPLDVGLGAVGTALDVLPVTQVGKIAKPTVRLSGRLLGGAGEGVGALKRGIRETTDMTAREAQKVADAYKKNPILSNEGGYIGQPRTSEGKFGTGEQVTSPNNKPSAKHAAIDEAIQRNNIERERLTAAGLSDNHPSLRANELNLKDLLAQRNNKPSLTSQLLSPLKNENGSSNLFTGGGLGDLTPEEIAAAKQAKLELPSTKANKKKMEAFNEAVAKGDPPPPPAGAPLPKVELKNTQNIPPVIVEGGAGVPKSVARGVSSKGTSAEKMGQPAGTTPQQIVPPTDPRPVVRLQPGGKSTAKASSSKLTPNQKAAKASLMRLGVDERTAHEAALGSEAFTARSAVDEYAQAFNVSRKQAKAELAAEHGDRTSMVSVEKGIRNTKRLVNSQGLPPDAQEATRYAIERKNSAQNNPIKYDIKSVNPGDYPRARANTQAVSNPISVGKDSVIRAINKLSNSEKHNFWKMVEDPSLAKSAAAKEAVGRWNQLSDTTHAISQALEGDTGYIPNYDFRNIEFSDAGTSRVLTELNGGNPVEPGDFKGIDNIQRLIPTRAEAERLGVKFKNPGNPAADVTEYANSRAGRLRKAALIKGLTEADSHNPVKNRALDLGNGQTLPLSEQGIKEAKTFEQHRPSEKKVVKGVRTLNTGLKSTILSLGQFHSINISVLRAAPTLAMKGHPISAAKGVYRTFRAAFGNKYADNVIGKAISDGTVEKAAKIGMPYGSVGYHTEGTWLKGGVGHKTVFEKQMPMMHDQVVRSIIHDLESKNIPLDSPEALKAGTVGNQLMGFINKEVLNMSPRVRQGMSDWMLAGQFTPSKILMVKDASSRGGVAGSYARRAVAANVVATTAVATGIGYLVHQQSDNMRDILLRSLVDPAVPTPLKDEKGNTIKFRLPGSDVSDIAHLIGVKLVRQDDGHLGVSWNPSNMPSTVEDFLRARLSPLASTAVKVATNTTFANKPLFDPNASAGTKIAQGATTVATGMLPIGLQGVAYTDAVKNHVPGAIKDVLDANTPGTNPVVKSLGSSFGLTPSTDQTVGKGLETAQYFGALDEAKQGLNRQERDALDLYSGSKKNPVTGKYDVLPTVDDQRAKATTLLQNGKVVDRLIEMNKKLKDKGQNVDPLWLQPKDKITAVLQYQTMPPHGPDQKNWKDDHPWYTDKTNGLQKQRQAFFDALPPGDPNKPKAPIEYPEASTKIQNLQETFFNTADAGERNKLMKAHPELQDQFDKQDKYYSDLRTAQGYTPLKNYPKATPQLQSFIDRYMGADKNTRKGLRNSNMDMYRNMSAYFDSTDLYNINNEGSQNQFVGNPDQTSKQNKAIKGLADDIYQNADGTYGITPAGWTYGMSDGSGGSGFGRRRGGGGSKGDGSPEDLTGSTLKYKVSLNAGGKVNKPTVSVRNLNSPKSKKKASSKSSKPKVSIKKSKV